MIALAAIQMLPTFDLSENLRQAEILIARAAQQDARLVVLPENFAYFGERSLDKVARAESTVNGPARCFLARMARQYGVWIVGGTIPVLTVEPGARRGHAACLCFNSDGEEVARYDKIHLFDADVGGSEKPYRESDDYRAGFEPMVLATPFGKLGLSVCYDLRFAELYRQLADLGAEIVVVPSAFTALTGKAHWELLLRARAVENQLFVVGANMGGRERLKNPTWGGSAIIHPWGNVLAELDDGEGVVMAELELDDIYQLKRKMPVSSHRRLQVPVRE